MRLIDQIIGQRDHIYSSFRHNPTHILIGRGKYMKLAEEIHKATGVDPFYNPKGEFKTFQGLSFIFLEDSQYGPKVVELYSEEKI